MMGVQLEGFRSLGSRDDRVESVAGSCGIECLRSGVLGLDPRKARRNNATVPVCARCGRARSSVVLWSGTSGSERLRRTERERDAAKNRPSAARERASSGRSECGHCGGAATPEPDRPNPSDGAKFRGLSPSFPTWSCNDRGEPGIRLLDSLRLISLASHPDRTTANPRGTRAWCEADDSVTFR